MVTRFNIQPADTVPIYRQIVEQVRRAIAAGQLRPGDELPSVRTLALEHTINPMTASKAYSLLEAEGLLERQRGRSMVVAAVRPAARLADRMNLLQPLLDKAAQQARELNLSDEEALRLFKRCLHAHPDETGDETHG